MDVLVTGASGRVGTAILDHLDRQQYNFTLVDREDDEHHETYVADITDYGGIRPAFDSQDAVVHLAGYPKPDGSWEQTLENNIVGMYNTLEAAKDADVETFVFASTNHVVGMYEVENSPDIYEPEFGLVVDHRSPVRPDSYYGVSKGFDEQLGRYYTETFDRPAQFYSLRLGCVRSEEYDHPYGDAEKGVRRDEWERGSERYHRNVKRMKAMWLSRRDLAHLVERCLRDETVKFDVFYGVSDNDARWFDLEHARSTIGYRPEDNGGEWDGPPA